uniref:protein-tyrosine-phosphatase n=1 Tax=Sinocyclocheilus anshuiensis TaxID=1608454 RepID=A0A671PR70_9TELE
MIGVGSGLYIGCVSDLKDAQSLTDAGVIHILTVDSEEPAVPGFHTKFVRALDDVSTDLLSRLDDCVSFICDALSTHSESKSSAVLDAYTKLRNLKPHVKMNEEFMDQLALYELMDCKVDTTNPLYKQFRLKKITEKYPELQNMPKDVFAVDPAQTQNAEAVYRCRKCRRTLFRHSSILSHCVGSGASVFSHKKMRIVSDSEDQRQCTSYFIEPVQWMEPALLGVMDRQLLCPKCSSKLGSFNWYGEQCSCGRWVTPAFQMHKNRVDEIKYISISALK